MDINRIVSIKGLDGSITSDILYAAFIPFGQIEDVVIADKPSSSGVSKRYKGFVTFELAKDAREAIDNMHLSMLGSRTIQCQVAKQEELPISVVRNDTGNTLDGGF
jgi:peptidyl-prolyl isomerase E (cyclophilin E)